jgi:aspartyl-tRNA synthetase
LQTNRLYSDNGERPAIEISPETQNVLDKFKRSIAFPSSTHEAWTIIKDPAGFDGQRVTLHGYLGTRRVASKSLTFLNLHDAKQRNVVQLVAKADNKDQLSELLRDLSEHSPVAVTGTVAASSVTKRRPTKADLTNNGSEATPKTLEPQSAEVERVEIRVESIHTLNSFPSDVIMSADTVFPPEQRHLQIRRSRELRDALEFRSQAANVVRQTLLLAGSEPEHNFTEIETPLLFKSTPEGAREFLVPTRVQGMAYALPQSPQQYKQILMASGITRYFQFAKCFRDEDLRADRQPEFTQIDMEMAFARGEDVMAIVEAVIRELWKQMLQIEVPLQFRRMKYDDAMATYGSDKPDLRFGSEISRIDYMLPVDLVRKIGPLDEPIVEIMKFSISDDPTETYKFVDSFMQSPEALPFIQNPHGQPGMFFYDSRKPLQGLQPFGFEAAEHLEEKFDLKDGDLLVLQARPDAPFAGGSTPIGNLRLALQKAAIKQSLLPPLTGFEFLWITSFPLFTPLAADDADPGQGGTAGFASTHHPFTAPATPEDVDRLLTDPTACIADHYDLVVNGVELGGGSRRIHSAELQRLVLRDVLRVPEARMGDFEHLLEVLRSSGCPPHAGVALGFDRLIAVMLGKESVRDVIAFPKSGRGEDALVKSPSRMTKEQMATYHLKVVEATKG